MPIPKPEANESQDKFIGRCIGFLVGEGKPNDQAAAICRQQWEDKGNDMKEPKTYDINEVPILKAGKFTDANGVKVELTDEKLTEIVANTNKLIADNSHEPPLKLGHDGKQRMTDGMPSLGWVSKLSKIGSQVFANFTDIPKKIYNLIQKRAYAKISSELYENLTLDGEKGLGYALRAVALLGADVPAIKGLGDIEKLYASEMPYNVLAFSEADLQEANSMSNLWTLERVEKSIPCCAEAVKKFMEEKKLDSIEVEDLVKIISAVKMSEAKKEDEEEKPKEPNMSEIASKKELTKEDVAAMAEEFKKITPEKLAEFKASVEKMQDDQRPPKGWWDECVASTAGTATDPEALCGWIYYNWMTPERKAEIEVTRAAEKPVEETEEEKKKKEEEEKAAAMAAKLLSEKQEAEAKVKALEAEKRVSAIKELTEKNRGVFLPKFDGYITALSEVFAANDSVIKFSEKEEKASDLFIKFLGEIAQSKVVIFEELMKSENKEKHDEIRKQKVEKKLAELNSKYSNITEKGHSFAEGEMELVALATVISEDENIGFADAYSKAKRSLNK